MRNFLFALVFIFVIVFGNFSYAQVDPPEPIRLLPHQRIALQEAEEIASEISSLINRRVLVIVKEDRLFFEYFNNSENIWKPFNPVAELTPDGVFKYNKSSVTIPNLKNKLIKLFWRIYSTRLDFGRKTPTALGVKAAPKGSSKILNIGKGLFKGGAFAIGLTIFERDHVLMAMEGSREKIQKAEEQKRAAYDKGYLRYNVYVPVVIGDGTILGRNKVVNRYNRDDLKKFLEDNNIPFNPNYNEKDFNRLYTIVYSYNSPDGKFILKIN